jgi:AcrR family transcriptional regulator
VPRKDRSPERRKELMPVVARTFAELGYRRTTTSELARRCDVRENILYRLWADKKEMFLEAIDYVFSLSDETWKSLIAKDCAGTTAAERILDYEAEHHGEFGLYRIVFAGLSEADDPEIGKALRKMYSRFHRFISAQIAAGQEESAGLPSPGPSLTAWAVIGLGTVANIGRELNLLSDRNRKQLIKEIGQVLLDGRDG